MKTSGEFEGWESADEVLQFARAAGHDPTRSQLVRWHKRGVIPRPRTRYQHGRRGLETLYPPGTARLVVDVCEIEVRRRGLETANWQLWWLGHDRDMAEIRSYLEKVCRDYDRTLSKFRGLVRSNAKVPGSSYSVRGYFRESPDAPPPLGTIRRHLNWGGRRDFDRFLELALRSMLGDATPPSAEECVLFEHALHFDEARLFPLKGARNWWEPEDGSAVTWMATFLSRPLVERLQEASDEDLLEARRLATQFFEFVLTFGEVMNWIFKREHGLGFGFVGKLVGRLLDEPGRQALMLLVFDAARRDRVLGKGLVELAPMFDHWTTEGYQAWQGVRLLASEVPAMSELLSPNRLRESFRSVKGQERLNQELVALRALHADEIDAVVARHPEVFPTNNELGETQRPAIELPESSGRDGAPGGAVTPPGLAQGGLAPWTDPRLPTP